MITPGRSLILIQFGRWGSQVALVTRTLDGKPTHVRKYRRTSDRWTDETRVSQSRIKSLDHGLALAHLPKHAEVP